MILRPSASKTESFFKCQWPWGRELPEKSVGDAAHYGSAFHEVMAAIALSPPRKIDVGEVARRFNVEGRELARHTREALKYLTAWLKADNPWRIDLVRQAKARTEQAIAYHVMGKRAHACMPPTGDAHEYLGGVDMQNELPGTADLVIDKIDAGVKGVKTAPDLIILDYKTGFHFDRPRESLQLRTLTLAFATATRAKRVAGAIFHTPREGPMTIYADWMDRELLREHAKKLQAAWSFIGTGTLTPGEHCTDCPALTICPAHTSALVQLKTNGVLTRKRVGEIHQALGIYDELSRRLREQIRADVRANGPGVRPDGKLVVLQEREAENLSKASIIRALGAVEGDKMISKLRKLGAVELTSREELRAVLDK